jgi:hypothetical protein
VTSKLSMTKGMLVVLSGLWMIGGCGQGQQPGLDPSELPIAYGLTASPIKSDTITAGDGKFVISGYIFSDKQPSASASIKVQFVNGKGGLVIANTGLSPVENVTGNKYSFQHEFRPLKRPGVYLIRVSYRGAVEVIDEASFEVVKD